MHAADVSMHHAADAARYNAALIRLLTGRYTQKTILGKSSDSILTTKPG